MPSDLSVPDAPVPVFDDWSGPPNVVLDGERYAIGWQPYPDEEGGPAYVTVRRGLFGFHRVLGRYPQTGDGWARAWAEFARLAPATAEKTRVALGRLYAARPPAGVLAFAPALILRAIDPPADGFVVGLAYDLRFGEDGLRIARPGSSQAIAEYEYAGVAQVQVQGFERILTVSRMRIFLNRGLIADEWYENRAYLRVQARDRTLEFRQVVRFPTSYRWLEPVNQAIRTAWLSAAAAKAETQTTEWIVSELDRLAERLGHGTVSRSDLDLLKARIISGH